MSNVHQSSEEKETKNVFPFIHEHSIATFDELVKKIFFVEQIDRMLFSHLYDARTKEVEEKEKKLH